ncbi:hypothetical protein PR202_gb24249 [Eleusine coracana subsp. coracana]|uniref:BHLH domain-containing protein n=1 Tax=Eleusine coracana subsp. coracana TaxID=191504 RepID=A0AAV5FL63_ELECO|nr:hypothetical protein PR202_gb24249 [Eleusine coracana subsp. coracana]
MELLWCNGHVVMQSQAPRKPPRPEKEAVQENAAAAWFDYPAAEDPLERDLFSALFGDTPAPPDPGRASCKAEEECVTTAAVTAPQSRLMPALMKARAEDVSGSAAAAATEAGGGGESSMLTIGSSFCGSNHVQATTPRAAPPVRADDAATVTSSSMMQPQPRRGAAAHRSAKRKQRDAAEITEDAEFESAVVTCEPAAQKVTTAKRRRAAEVHNLSERRRRDRINEKMKALQELIPHCNKTDKASMLDEAIEYLKSLRLQLQVMWMGGGMATAAPVMFPAGLHHQYMQQMVGHPHLASSMPRMPPFMAAAAVQSPPVVAADPYGLQQQQQPGPMHYLQGMGFYHQQQSPARPPPVVPGGGGCLTAPTERAFPSDSNPHRKHHETSSKHEIKGVTS